MGERVAVLGAGVMGETLLAGVLRSGRSAEDVVVAERRAERAAELTERYGVRVVTNAEAVTADTVFLVVKPQDLASLLDEIRDQLQPNALVVSVAAGITTGFLEGRLRPGTAVVRAMPNTPALVARGMTAISPGQHCTAGHLDRVRVLLSATGAVLEVPEHQQDAVTAVSGSGPAYVFYVAEAMIEAGVFLGLPRTSATELVVQTLQGASEMLRETGEHPSLLRERVSSPAGTTIAALRQLDDHRVRAAFLTAMEAARDRSRELSGQGYGPRIPGLGARPVLRARPGEGKCAALHPFPVGTV
jgi:pyrroline-5-carboxylate reductase